jgi:hypothetical protein
MKCKFFLALALVAAALVLGFQPSAHAQFGSQRPNYPGRCGPGFGGPGFGGPGFGGPGVGGPGFGGPGFGGPGFPGSCGSNNCQWVYDPWYGWVCMPLGGFGGWGGYGSYGSGYSGVNPYRR